MSEAPAYPDFASDLVKRAIAEEREDYERRRGLITSPKPPDFSVQGPDNPFFRSGDRRIEGSTAAAAQSTPTHPFLVTAFNDSGTWKYRVVSGTFNGNVPTLGGTALNAGTAPVGTLGTGTKYVYLHISATLTAAHDYVYTFTFDDFKIESGSSVPNDDTAAGEYYIPLASFLNGVKTSQVVISSLGGFIEDDGNGASQGELYFYAA